jgi:hypothetical protein
MNRGTQSRRSTLLSRVSRFFRSALWLFVFGLTSIGGGGHWATWECNLPPRISETFACYMTLDVHLARPTTTAPDHGKLSL